MALGAYHDLLPRDLRRRAIIEQFDVQRFIHAVANLGTQCAPEGLAESLLELIGATD